MKNYIVVLGSASGDYTYKLPRHPQIG